MTTTDEPGARRDDDATALPDVVRGVPWRDVLLAAVVSRVLAAGAIVGAASWPFGDGLRTGGFRLWDGFWYTAIAGSGYGAPPIGDEQTRWPFFPLLPGVMRGFDELGIDGQVATILLGQVAFVVALAGIHRLAARRSTPRAALLAVWSCALFPGSFVFTMLYPSAIFLAATVWAFVLVDERFDLAAGVAAAVGTIVRPNGALVVAALAVAVRFAPRRVLLVGAPAGLALAGWMAYLWDRSGDPFVFWTTKDAWSEISIFEFVVDPLRYDVPAAHLGLGLVAIAVLVLRRRVMPAAWLVWSALVLVPPLLVGLVGMGRYAAECFPVFVAAGQLLDERRPAHRRALLAVSAVGMVFCAVMVIRFDRVP